MLAALAGRIYNDASEQNANPSGPRERSHGLILEWIFERREPGPVGRVDVATPYTKSLTLWQLLLRFAFAAVILVTAARVILGADHRLLAGLTFATYLIVSYLIRPQADHSNTGVLGFIDHPLKWTDDANRFLIFLRVILLPGRITAAAIRDVFAIVLGRRRLRPPATQPGGAGEP